MMHLRPPNGRVQSFKPAYRVDIERRHLELFTIHELLLKAEVQTVMMKSWCWCTTHAVV